MPKVVLVHPPIVFGKRERLALPPLGILYLATYLRKKGIEADIVDAFIRGHTYEELLGEILAKKPDIVGLTAMTCQVPAVLDVIEAIKRKAPSIKIVIGGHHVNATKEELLAFSSHVDFLLYGEGEIEFHNLVRALETNGPLDRVRGLIYRNNDDVVRHAGPLPIQNLDELPFPDLSLLDIKRYDIHYAKSRPLTSMLASRGCPFDCLYCGAALAYGRAVRFRSPANVVDEMAYHIQRFGIKQFLFKDSTLTADKKWVYDICSEIQERNLKINWTCNTRAELVDEGLLKAMKKSGCHGIAFGLESGSQRILDLLQKEMTIEQIRHGLSLCQAAGIERIGTFMIGNPTETPQEAKATLRFLKELDLDLAFVFITTAYPGTALYKWALENDALSDTFWYMRRRKTAPEGDWELGGSLKLKDFPIQERVRMVRRATRSFYLSLPFMRKRIKKIRSLSDIARNIKPLGRLFLRG